MDIESVLASFSLLLLMEMGDKTQLAVLTLAASTGRGLAVAIGATLALAVTTLLGAIGGAAVREFIPLNLVSRIAALTFIALGGFMLWASRQRTSRGERGSKTKEVPATVNSGYPWKVLAVTFGLLFLAEMGDKTQLAVVALTAKSGSPLSVFLGAILALALLTFLAALTGRLIIRLIPVRWLSRGAALLFILFGVLSLLGKLGTL